MGPQARGGVGPALSVSLRLPGNVAMSSPDQLPLPAEAWLAALVDGSEDAIVSKTLDGTVTSWNRAAERLFGYTAGEMIGTSLWIIAGPGGCEEMQGILARIRRGERVEHHDTLRRRKDGTLVHVSVTVSPIRDASGHIVGASKIARDVGERKRWEKRQQGLVEELNHRVKNSLATVQSLARHSARGAGSLDVFLGRFTDRLGAMVVAHDLLAAAGWSAVPVETVVGTALAAPMSARPGAFLVTVCGGCLSPALAQSLTLLLRELATNAASWGALTRKGGTVRLEGHRRGTMLELLWREQGGPEVVPPDHHGLGTVMLMKALGHQHGGSVELDWRREGLVCSIMVPVAPDGPATRSV